LLRDVASYLNAGQLEVKSLVNLLDHEWLNRSPFDKLKANR